MSDRIGGTLDAAGLARLAGHVTDDEYRERADRHRPNPAGVQAEALRLSAEGWSFDDISAVLRTDRRQIAAWLAEAPE